MMLKQKDISLNKYVHPGLIGELVYYVVVSSLQGGCTPKELPRLPELRDKSLKHKCQCQ